MQSRMNGFGWSANGSPRFGNTNTDLRLQTTALAERYRDGTTSANNSIFDISRSQYETDLQLKTNFESVTLKDIAPKQFKFLTNFFFRMVTKLMRINMHILDKNPLEPDAEAEMERERQEGNFSRSPKREKKSKKQKSDVADLDDVEEAQDGKSQRSVSPNSSPRAKAKHLWNGGAAYQSLPRKDVLQLVLDSFFETKDSYRVNAKEFLYKCKDILYYPSAGGEDADEIAAFNQIFN